MSQTDGWIVMENLKLQNPMRDIDAREPNTLIEISKKT
jgi:hypothetical protein